MNHQPLSNEQLEEFILRHFDEELTEEEQLILADTLAQSESARNIFGDYMRLEGRTQQLGLAKAISSSGGAADTTDTTILDRAEEVRPRKFVTIFVSFVAGALAASLLFGLVLSHLTPQNTTVGVAASNSSNDTSAKSSVAKIRRLVNVRWNQPGAKRNDPLSAQTVEIESGILEIEFEHGAVVRLEGPAKYDIRSADETFLHFGRLQSFSSTDSYGFQVSSNSICIVDLGTDFGIDIPQNGDAEIHVFRGKTEIFDPVEETETRFASMLSSGQAMRIHETGYRTKIEANRAAFADWSEVESRTQSYVTDLQTQLASLRRTSNKLAKEQKNLEADVLKSQIVANHLRQIHAAENEMKDLRNKNEAYLKAEETGKKVTERLRRQVRKEANKSEAGREICAELDSVNEQLTELTKSDRSLEKQRQHRALQKTRLQLQRKLRDLVAKELKNNPKLKELYSEQRRVQRELRQTMSKSEFLVMERRLSRLRKAFASAKRKALSGNQRLKEIRREQKSLTKQMEQVTQRIADTQWMSDVYSPREINEFEPDRELQDI